VTAAAAIKAEDPAALVPFSKMTEPQKGQALEALAAEVLRVGGASGLTARLAGQLRREPTGALFIELDLPRISGSGFPSSRWIGGGHFESWALDLVAGQLPPGLATDEAFALATESKILPLVEAVALVSGPDDPIAEMSRRRVEVERRIAERKRVGEEQSAARARDEAAERAWLNKNASRMHKWGALPRLPQDIAEAARKTGDPVLIAFAKNFVEASAAAWPPSRPPDWLWEKLSG
jgi:hypothetical protein